MNPRAIPPYLILLTLLAGCGLRSNEIVAGPGDLGHTHDLVIGDDGAVLVATHTGLYRIDGPERAVLMGTEQHDLMAMSKGADGGLMVSGHPDLRLEEYRVEDRPPFFGLATTDDRGETWEAVELLGEADFHALVWADETLFAAETGGSVWRLNSDGRWTTLGEVEARDLAIDPDDPSYLLAADWDSNVWISSDGASTWAAYAGAPGLTEIEWPDSSGAVGIDPSGSIWRLDSAGGEWEEIGEGPTEVETFLMDTSGGWWMASEGGSIRFSDNRGLTWTVIYDPPTND